MAHYVELVVHGNNRDLKAFLTGFLSEPTPPRIVYAEEAGFQLHRLRERITHHGEVQHLIVEQEHAERIRAALNASRPRYAFEIKEEMGVDTGLFSFDFDTPSRDVANKIKTQLEHLPVGAVLRNYVPREESRSGNAGAELYTPAHDYRFSGRGVIRGGLFPLVDARASMVAVDFMRCDEIEIEDT